MELVGNDVVDLAEPAIGAAHRSDRFARRVCTDAEREALDASGDPRTLLWILFAAKEAAYKVAVRLGPDPGFAHRRFEVAPDLSAVRFGGLVLPLSAVRFGGLVLPLSAVRFGGLVLPLSVEVDRAAGWIHAVASTVQPTGTLRGVVRIPAGSDESEVARRALRRAAARKLRCRARDLSVTRDESPGSWTGLGPPRLLRQGRPVPGCISLSHDGRFAAFACR